MAHSPVTTATNASSVPILPIENDLAVHPAILLIPLQPKGAALLGDNEAVAIVRLHEPLFAVAVGPAECQVAQPARLVRAPDLWIQVEGLVLYLIFHRVSRVICDLEMDRHRLWASE